MENHELENAEIGDFYASRAEIEGITIFVVKVENINDRQVFGKVFRPGRDTVSNSESIGHIYLNEIKKISADDLAMLKSISEKAGEFFS